MRLRSTEAGGGPTRSDALPARRLAIGSVSAWLQRAFRKRTRVLGSAGRADFASLSNVQHIFWVSNVLTIRLDEETAKALETEAKRTGASKGEVVRAAIRDRLVSTRSSALEALRDIDGIVDGPADLSTNERYLASLGRRAPSRTRRPARRRR